jgi:hypothetical protein
VSEINPLIHFGWGVDMQDVMNNYQKRCAIIDFDYRGIRQSGEKISFRGLGLKRSLVKRRSE